LLRPILELLRVYLTPTAAADSFAGYCLGMQGASSSQEPSRVLAVTGASVLLYWSGMAANDLFDLERDRRIHPGRPLPRGAVRPRTALGLALLLGAAGVAAAALVSRDAALAAAALLLLASLYNTGGKRIPIVGNLLMGSCRSTNLLLGALGPLPLERLLSPGERHILFAAGFLGLYIAGVTAVSLLEDLPPSRARLAVTAGPVLLCPALLAVFGGLHIDSVANAVVLTWILVRGISGPVPAGMAPDLHPAERFVRAGLSGIFLIDAGLLLANGLHKVALAEYGLMILAWLWRRRWLQSPP
jgi:4-hydroxybenzoate polyprenyltransferase